MVISQHDLQRARPDYVSEDRACVRCGYNLKGLKTTANCPECGRPISKRRRGYRSSDNLVQAPLSWLLCFKLAAILLMLAGAAAVIVQFFGSFLNQHVPDVVPLAAMSAAVAWMIGIFLATRPRPVTAATTTDPREEWRMTRWLARLTQVGWPLAAITLIIISQMIAANEAGQQAANLAAAAGTPIPAIPPMPGTWMFILSGGLSFVAAIGLVCVCVYLSNICFWASDTTLGMNFRACSWTVTAAAVSMVLLAIRLFVIARAPGGPGTIGAIITWPVLLAASVFTFIALMHLLWCLWKLQGMAAWAVVNHVTAEGREDRMRERAAQATLNEQRRRQPR